MLQSVSITCSIRVPATTLYDRFWRPEAFPQWASGLAQAGLKQDPINGGWIAQGPERLIRITFSEHNTFGVMDHWVDLGSGKVIYIPLRVVANGDSACEVMFLLYRQPEMDDAKFQQDAEWVDKDLAELKKIAELA